MIDLVTHLRVPFLNDFLSHTVPRRPMCCPSPQSLLLSIRRKGLTVVKPKSNGGVLPGYQSRQKHDESQSTKLSIAVNFSGRVRNISRRSSTISLLPVVGESTTEEVNWVTPQYIDGQNTSRQCCKCRNLDGRVGMETCDLSAHDRSRASCMAAMPSDEALELSEPHGGEGDSNRS